MSPTTEAWTIRRSGWNGFIRIELLGVFAIIANVAGFLLPALAQHLASRIKCTSDMN